MINVFLTESDRQSSQWLQKTYQESVNELDKGKLTWTSVL